MEELKREKTRAYGQMSLYKRLFIICAVLAALMGGLTGYLVWRIGDGEPSYDTVAIPREEYAPYARDAEPWQYVRADVVALRHVFGVVHQMVSGNGSRLIPEKSSYAEMTLADGSICLLTWDGEAERLEEFVSAIDRRYRAAQLGLNNITPTTVYGRTTLLAGTATLSDVETLNRTDSGLFPLKPEGMTDAEYWDSLTGVAVIDLDKADATRQVLNEEDAARLARLQTWKQIVRPVFLGLLVMAGCAFVLLRKAKAQFVQLVVKQRRLEQDTPSTL